MNLKRHIHSRGFSLTEVTIALGIIGFCALAVMGLIPLAANSYRQSYDQTQAAQVLAAFANGFYAPATNNGTNLPPPFGGISLTANSTGTLYITDANSVSTNSGTGTNAPRYKLTYQITAPANAGMYGGYAFASVSWPVGANNSVVQGSLSAPIYYNLYTQ